MGWTPKLFMLYVLWAGARGVAGQSRRLNSLKLFSLALSGAVALSLTTLWLPMA